MPKSTIDLVVEGCNYLKYESIFHKIHLTETGNSFFESFPILNYSGKGPLQIFTVQ